MSSTPLRWSLQLAPERSIVHVETRLRLEDGDRFILPTWIPGSYMVREFVRGLQDLQVENLNGQAIPLEHPEKATWVVRLDTPQEVVIRYAVYGRELTVRTTHIDNTHAFFNGANVFLRFDRYADAPQQVQLKAPDGWENFVSLPRVQGYFEARDYVHLADTVFESGPHETHLFHVDNIPHRMIFWGAKGLLNQLPQLEEDTRAIIQANRETFQSPLPYERYDIIFHVTPSARGGLEHRDSTTLATPWAYFETEAGYLDMLTLIAHEHFHAYNGRRLAPASLEAIDYSKENYTQELWVIEGFTSYFDELNTLRAGRMTDAQWLERTGKAFTQLFRTFGRTRQSLTEASFDAWIRLYRPYEHTRNQSVSYYLKGSLVALAIDLTLRGHSGGEYGLERVLQQLWREWKEENIHYTTDSVIRLIAEHSTVEIGTTVQQWVEGTEEPPYQELLATHGIAWREEAAEPADFGITFDTSGDSPVIQSLDETRADALQNLHPGDEVVALNERRVRSEDIQTRLLALSESDAIEHTFTVFRLGRLHQCTVQLHRSTRILLALEDTNSPERAQGSKLLVPH